MTQSRRGRYPGKVDPDPKGLGGRLTIVQGEQWNKPGFFVRGRPVEYKHDPDWNTNVFVQNYDVALKLKALVEEAARKYKAARNEAEREFHLKQHHDAALRLLKLDQKPLRLVNSSHRRLMR